MLRRLTTTFLLLAVVCAALFLFAPDSDGAFASFDGVLYGVEAEHQHARAIRGQHPLCHAIILALMPVLTAAGVTSPGHVAARIVSGFGAAVVLLIVVRAAGTRRWYVGAGLAVVLFATREVMIDTAVGETVLPGCAAALWLLDQATRTPVRLGRVWTGLVIALLVRQDNVLIVPGVILALWMGMDPAGRIRLLAGGLIGCAVVTLAGYATCWWLATRGHVSFWNYLVLPALGPEWTGPNGFEIGRFPLQVDAWSAGVTGRFWPRSEPNLWIGPGFVVALLLAAFLLSGRARVGPASLAVGITIVIRALFFTWWSVASPKWSVLTLCLAAFLGARFADGEPRLRFRVRTAGSIVLLILSALPLVVHGRLTWHLRERRFIGAMTQAVQAGRGCRFIAHGPSVALAFEFLGVPYAAVEDLPDPRASLEEVTRQVQQHPVPTMVVMDRLMLSNDPYLMMRERKAPMFLDAIPSTPRLSILRWEGLAYAVRFDPTAPR